jgi:uncharacterized repeat protein (TIGR01451 family)
MMPRIYTALLVIFCLATTQRAGAQCTSSAGTLVGTAPIDFCEESLLSVMPTGDAVLDSNDIIRFVAYTGATPGPGNVLATSIDGNFPYQPNFLSTGTFKVALVVGNPAGNTVDWNDPCLSISPGLSVICRPLPVLTGENAVLTCISPTVLVSVSSNMPVSYNWSTGGVLPSTHIFAPGVYCVTATSAYGCTSSTCITVTQDIASPIAVAKDTVLNCSIVTLDGTGSSVGPLFTYSWSGAGNIIGGVTTLTPVVSLPGTYTLVVTNVANGCTATTTATVYPSASPLGLTSTVQNIRCHGDHNGAIAINGFGGQPPYTYAWVGPDNLTSTQPSINNLGPGTYLAVVSDAAGCSQSAVIVLTDPDSLVLTLSETISGCGPATIMLSVIGGNAPYQYDWNTFSHTPVLPDVPVGTYTVTVTDALGCSVVLSHTVFTSNPGSGCGFFTGRVVRDTILNCFDDNEPALAGWLVQAVGAETSYAVTDSNGNYVLSALPGDYTISVVQPNGLWVFCDNDYQATIAAADQIVPLGTTLVKPQALCPAMTVSISTPQLRRCFSNNYYYVNYCNQGTALAPDAYILVELDDFISALGASIPFTTVGNHTLRFNIGDVPIGECGNFYIEVNVSCNAALGQTHCTEAHVYPDSLCTTANALWSGALLDLNAHCAGDSLHFVIKNIGTSNLNESVDYIVIEDHVMLMMANIGFLASGDSVTVSVPANGSTWRVESEQAAYAPMLNQLGLSIEGCSNGGSFSSGFVNQYPNGSDDPWVDTDCTTNVGSFDPNDKQGIPLGYGPQHFIRPGTEIEYMIRFQNTGTDTAFNIVVLDTLSTALDPRTIQVGSSSHPYRWDVFGQGVLRFKFENIQLPDSNKNEAASHGFVKFSIKPKADAPLGTVIRNTGAIYFDFNDPVITNTTDHILAENFVVTASWQPVNPLLQLNVAPNPFDVETRFEIKGLTNPAPIELRVYDLQGRVVRTMNVAGPVFTLKKQDLKEGTYLFRLEQEGRMVGSGKLMVAAKP